MGLSLEERLAVNIAYYFKLPCSRIKIGFYSYIVYIDFINNIFRINNKVGGLNRVLLSPEETIKILREKINVFIENREILDNFLGILVDSKETKKLISFLYSREVINVLPHILALIDLGFSEVNYLKEGKSCLKISYNKKYGTIIINDKKLPIQAFSFIPYPLPLKIEDIKYLRALLKIPYLRRILEFAISEYYKVGSSVEVSLSGNIVKVYNKIDSVNPEIYIKLNLSKQNYWLYITMRTSLLCILSILNSRIAIIPPRTVQVNYSVLY